ncbi:MAG TPA: hypothetical protein VD764_01940 [Nocardioides sp.]|nr:hypothetical protein [Nocardioides sp.]
MNDEHDADPDDITIDPEQDARLRALLAELGSGPDGEPIPPEVEARLDDTLALLVAERGRAAGGSGEDEAGQSTTGNVVPLRRRWLPRAGAAAAAVIVLGVGGLAVANFSGLSQSEQQSSSDSAGASAPKAESGADSETGSEPGSDSSTAATQLPDLSAASFESDVSVLLQGRASMLASEGEAAREGEAAEEPAPTSRDNALAGAPGVLPSRACPGPEVTDGAAARQVRYDGRRAVLLVHPERGGRLLVEAWNCEGDQRLASTKIKP